jgi:hypothetical protein
MKKILLIGLLFLFAMGTSAQAVSLNVNFDPGITQVTTALTGFETSGDDMVGMDVTFVGSGGSQTLSWAATAPGAGGASSSAWSLTQSGDTFDSNWTLTNIDQDFIDYVLIDAGAGDTVFDRDWSPFPGTDGSANGRTFTVSGTNLWDIEVTYIDQVALTGDAPVGDLYRSMKIDFVGDALFDAGSALNFLADTDNLKISGDITPDPVPEPSTMLLIGLGLVGLAGLRRRTK